MKISVEPIVIKVVTIAICLNRRFLTFTVVLLPYAAREVRCVTDSALTVGKDGTTLNKKKITMAHRDHEQRRKGYHELGTLHDEENGSQYTSPTPTGGNIFSPETLLRNLFATQLL